jgi:hypothetical protein
MTALNAYVNTNRFSLEGWPEMFQYARTAKFGIKFDIKKFYYHIDLAPEQYRYFGFSYVLNDGDKPEFFVWTTLPFGYTRAPYIVRHLIKPLISKWRSLGASCVVFYDDGMCVDDSATNLQKMSLQIQCDLLRAGLLPGVEKCSWLPVQQLDWNGLRFDFVKSGMEILPERVRKLKDQAAELIAAWPRVSYRDLARFVGRVVSMAPVFQGLVTIRTKMCQTFVNIRNYRNEAWDVNIHSNYGPLYAEALAEIRFWNDYVSVANNRSFISKPVHWTVWTDASQNNIAGVAVNHALPLVTGPLTADNLILDPKTNRFIQNYYEKLTLDFDITQFPGFSICRDTADLNASTTNSVKIVRRSLTSLEKLKDSNERELLAVQYTLHALLPFFKNCVVNFHTDSMNAAIILNQGSNKPRLQYYAKLISDYCIANDIVINVDWIPRDLNHLADSYTRIYDQHSYSVSKNFYSLVQKDFLVTPNLDLFANELNAKCDRFFSITSCPHTLGVDAFKYYWGPPNICWLFPPPKLVLEAVLKLQADKGEGLLLIPQWKNANFYPHLRKLKSRFGFEPMVYNGKNVFIGGDDPTSFFDKNFVGNVEIWHLNFLTV